MYSPTGSENVQSEIMRKYAGVASTFENLRQRMGRTLANLKNKKLTVPQNIDSFRQILETTDVQNAQGKETLHLLLLFSVNSLTNINLKEEEHKKLLLLMLDVCATNQIPDRVMVRHILAKLYDISRKIDREVLYWDSHKLNDTDQERAEALAMKSKQAYVLEQAAGWALDDNNQTWTSPTSSGADYYLELPFARCPGEEGETQLLPDAMYNVQDTSLVLTLLRHGVRPTSLYLWPITMNIDLRLAICGSSIGEEDVRSWKEMDYIRYFSRARSSFNVQVILSETDKDVGSDVSYESILMVPPRARPYIPEFRVKQAASLQHYCRLTIRKSLLESDHLPRGIPELPLPRVLKHYVDLLED